MTEDDEPPNAQADDSDRLENDDFRAGVAYGMETFGIMLFHGSRLCAKELLATAAALGLLCLKHRARGLTVQDFAAKLGMNPSTLYERKRAIITALKLSAGKPKSKSGNREKRARTPRRSRRV